MRIKRGVITVLTVFTAAVLMHGCNKIDDDVLNAQRKNMISYLNSSEFEKNANGDPRYEEVGGVYRYVRNPGRAGYNSATVIKKGDLVEFWFVAELFTTKPVGVVYSNIPEVIDELADYDKQFTLHWPREVMKVELGRTDLIKGLSRGLNGCREGDTTLLLITPDLAYGKKPISIMPEEASLAYTVIITQVTSNQ